MTGYSIFDEIEDDERNDDEKRERAETLKEIQEQRIRNDLLSVLESQAGKNVLWRLIESCQPFQTTHRGENTHDSSFYQGRCSVGLQIMNDIISTSPECWLSLQANQMNKKDKN